MKISKLAANFRKVLGPVIAVLLCLAAYIPAASPVKASGNGTGILWGFGSMDTSNNPSLSLVGLGNIASFDAGYGGHSLAVTTDGYVYAWGDNSYGQLGTAGNNAASSSPLPVQASGLSGAFTAISSSYLHNLALKSDGTVWAWGNNSQGGLGVTTPSHTDHPVQVQGFANTVLFISAGYNDSAAIVMPLSADSTLSSLTISPGLLSPTFDSAITTYTDNVANSVTAVTVVPTVHQANATIKVNGSDLASGATSGSLSLNNIAPGTNTITVVITAQDTTVTTYTITVTRAAAATLTVSGFTSPCIVNTADTITVTAKDSGGNTAIGYSGTVQFTSTDGSANLPGNYTFTTIDDGSHTFTNGVTLNTVGTQSVTVTDISSSSINGSQSGIIVNPVSTTTSTSTTTTTPLAQDATLSSLTISSVTLNQTFDPGTIAYTASVPYSMSSVTVTPTGNATPSKITVNGITVTSGTSSGAVNLSAGANTIAVVVISQDTVHNDTYTVIVTRALPLTVDDLTGLTISPGTLSPEFGSGTTTYTGSIATGVNAVTVTPTVAESSYATITVNGNAVTGGSRTINLNVGSNTITIAVTAQDGTTTKSYIVTINATALPTTTASPTTTTQTTEVVQPPPAATTTTTTTPTTTTTTTTRTGQRCSTRSNQLA